MLLILRYIFVFVAHDDVGMLVQDAMEFRGGLAVFHDDADDTDLFFAHRKAPFQELLSLGSRNVNEIFRSLCL